MLMMLVVYVGMSFATALSASHSPVAWQGHDNVVMTTAHSGESDHNHDDFGHPQAKADYAHSHHAADHTHEPPALLRSLIHAVNGLSDHWDTLIQAWRYPSPHFTFERPPRHVLLH